MTSDTYTLIRTKLHKPRVTPDLVERPRLTERLDKLVKHNLTLISAPAGYGKSTLVSDWLDQCQLPYAWISLDEHNNDLAIFLAYMSTAVQDLFPNSLDAVQSLLAIPQLPALSHLTTSLINGLDGIQQPFVLVLDDYHFIHNESIHRLMNEVLRYPPHSLHLVLITRRDPPLDLITLRARHSMSEIHAIELKFTREEVAQFLELAIEQPLNDTDITNLTDKTDGWATGLRLASLKMRESDDVSAFVEHMPEAGHVVRDYLVAEVTSQIPVVMREALIRIAILDRFCAPLWDALWRPDADLDKEVGSGKALIQWLQRNNLFISSLDEKDYWFRLHHLFQHVLQQTLHERFSPDEIAALHKQAGHWFDANQLWDEALWHFLEAGDTSAAIHFVINHSYDLINTQQWQRLNRWFQLLPEGEVAQDPHLFSVKLHLMLQAHSQQASDVIIALQQGKRLLSTLSPESEAYKTLRAEMTVSQGVVNVAMGEPEWDTVNLQQSLRLLPAQARFSRILGNCVVAINVQIQGQHELGMSLIKEVLTDTDITPQLRPYVLHFLSIAHFLEGDLNGVLAASREALSISQKLGLPWTINYARHNLGVAHYLRDEFEEAEPYLRALLADRVTSPPTYLAIGSYALALIHVSRGQWSQAAHILDLVSAQFGETDDVFAMTVTQAFRVELALREGNFVEAQHLSMGVKFSLRPPTWFFYIPQLTAMKLLLADGTPESLVSAQEALETLDKRMAAINRKYARIDVLNLLALVCNALGDTTAAFAKLTEALIIAEPGGFIRNFLDLGMPMAKLLIQLLHLHDNSTSPSKTYITGILDAFARMTAVSQYQGESPTLSSSPKPATPEVESLTKRESQILELVATDLSPQEIAQHLDISVTTARTHIRNIYSKLDVHSRFEAVYRAKELNLL